MTQEAPMTGELLCDTTRGTQRWVLGILEDFPAGEPQAAELPGLAPGEPPLVYRRITPAPLARVRLFVSDAPRAGEEPTNWINAWMVPDGEGGWQLDAGQPGHAAIPGPRLLSVLAFVERAGEAPQHPRITRTILVG